MFKKLSNTLCELDAILANFEKDMVEFDKSMMEFDSIMSDLDKMFGHPHPDQNNRINMDSLLKIDNSIKWDD
jgi:hypothetical protein